MDSEYEETLKPANELVTILKNDDFETQHFKEYNEVNADIENTKDELNESVKHCIKAMTDQFCEEQTKAEDSRSEEEIRCQEDVVRKQMSTITLHVKEVNENIDNASSKVKEVHKKRDVLTEGKHHIERSNKVKLPKAKCEFDLFSNVTNIRWDLESSSDEVNGYICQKKGVKPFFLNKKQNSQFFIINSLWDLMEEDW